MIRCKRCASKNSELVSHCLVCGDELLGGYRPDAESLLDEDDDYRDDAEFRAVAVYAPPSPPAVRPVVASVTCVQCSARNPAGADTCRRCGAELPLPALRAERIARSLAAQRAATCGKRGATEPTSAGRMLVSYATLVLLVVGAIWIAAKVMTDHSQDVCVARAGNAITGKCTKWVSMDDPSLETRFDNSSPYDDVPHRSSVGQGGDVDCSDFSTHAEAQAFFLNAGGPYSDPYLLDADGDGSACESLP